MVSGIADWMLNIGCELNVRKIIIKFYYFWNKTVKSFRHVWRGVCSKLNISLLMRKKSTVFIAFWERFKRRDKNICIYFFSFSFFLTTWCVIYSARVWNHMTCKFHFWAIFYKFFSSLTGSAFCIFFLTQTMPILKFYRFNLYRREKYTRFISSLYAKKKTYSSPGLTVIFINCVPYLLLYNLLPRVLLGPCTGGKLF